MRRLLMASAVYRSRRLTLWLIGRPRHCTANMRLNRWFHVAGLMATWVALQWMAGYLAGGQGVMLATPAHIGGFIAGLLLQRPLLLWRYRRA